MLLNSAGHVMLTDFGLSKVAVDASTICGTLEFMAPEVLAEKTYDRTVDFWSLGLISLIRNYHDFNQMNIYP